MQFIKGGTYYQIINFRVDRRDRNPTNVRNQCRGEPYVRPPNNNR